MSKKFRVLVLPGDGIGAEVMPHAIRVLDVAVAPEMQIDLQYAEAGGCAIDKYGTPLLDETVEAACNSDAVLLGAVGGPKWDDLPMSKKPEAGLLKLRSSMECFANLRPAFTFAALAEASTLKTELVSNLDIVIVRELVGGIYFGEPRGIEIKDNTRRGFNTLSYDESEIERIATVAFELAQKREKRICSVDKANVLDVMQLWRDVVTETHQNYKDVELSHMYVDNAAMQMVRNPKQFDVIVTGNMFGDILSDIAAMLTGSMGMLPSASLNADRAGLYEPVHGTAPDIAGLNKANPLAMILSIALMLRYSLDNEDAASRIEKAVESVLSKGIRTADIAPIEASDEISIVGTDAMGDAVVQELEAA